MKVLSLKNIILISSGILSAAFGLKGFLLPNAFIDGGVTGISLLIHQINHFNISLLLIFVNFPFIVLAYFQIGQRFALQSIAAILGLSLVIHLFGFPLVTSDKLLISTFGGFFLGLGIGLAMRGGAVLDGTEVLAIFLSKKVGLSVGDIIFIFNMFIFSAVAYFMSVETALYAILTYIVAAKTIDFTITGVEEYIGVTIISSQSEDVRKMIVNQMGRGVTIYSGKGGYAENKDELTNYDIIYTILTRLEVPRLQREVYEIDPKSFVVMSSIKDTRGGMIKRRALEH